MKTRADIQNEIVNLSDNYNNLLLSLATGVGKSLAFILIQEKVKAENTYIIVSESAHIQNWIEEYKKHNKEYLLEKTKIFCYASLKKNIDTKIDLLCLDESHHGTTEIRTDYLKKIKSNKVVLLTATLGTYDKSIYDSLFGNFYEYKITPQQAIDWGILPKPIINLIPLELDNTTRNQTIIFQRGKKDLQTLIGCNYNERWNYMKDKERYPNIRLIIHCTTLEKNTNLDEQISYYKDRYMQERVERLKLTWLKLGSERKRFLGETKTLLVSKFLKSIQDKRFICFCSSIDQANKLGNELNTVHSKIKKPQNIIDSFNNKEINQLYTVGMLQEGQNLNDIEAGIMIQVDGQERAYIQKQGRILRAEDPILYIFYYKGCRDEEYIMNALENIDTKFIQNIQL